MLCRIIRGDKVGGDRAPAGPWTLARGRSGGPSATECRKLCRKLCRKTTQVFWRSPSVICLCDAMTQILQHLQEKLVLPSLSYMGVHSAYFPSSLPVCICNIFLLESRIFVICVTHRR